MYAIWRRVGCEDFPHVSSLNVLYGHYKSLRPLYRGYLTVKRKDIFGGIGRPLTFSIKIYSTFVNVKC